MSRHIIPKSAVPVPLPIVFPFHVSPLLRDREGRLCTLIIRGKKSADPRADLARCYRGKHASRRACHQTHLQSFRCFLHITSLIPQSLTRYSVSDVKNAAVFLFFGHNFRCIFFFYPLNLQCFLSPAVHRWGRSKPAQLGSLIFMQPPLHHHKPAVKNSQTPLLFGAELN